MSINYIGIPPTPVPSEGNFIFKINLLKVGDHVTFVNGNIVSLLMAASII